MARISFTAAADADVAVIFDDLYAKAGKSTVLKYRSALRALYSQIAEFPDSGAPRPKLGANIRIGVVHPYIVIYRHTETDNSVRVLRLVHGSREITGKLLRGAS